MYKLLHTKQLPILEQLHLEEALLRVDQDSWVIINEGSPPAIVMGISGKPDELIDLEKARKKGIPIIKRFSGGGTVVIDHNTLFITFICKADLHPFTPYPEAIMRWTEEFYRPLFTKDQMFSLRENDYVFGDKKFGGNAQYIKKARWLHHTSFLWDYESDNMELLLQPKRAPEYRAERTHEEFICKMKDYVASKENFIEAFKKQFPGREVTLEEAHQALKMPHRRTTKVLQGLRVELN